MTLVPHKITALAESDAQGTDGKNIVAGAVVSLFDEDNNPVMLFDNEAGANGSTTKTTDATGQVVVYVTPGEYEEQVNGGTRRKISLVSYVEFKNNNLKINAKDYSTVTDAFNAAKALAGNIGDQYPTDEQVTLYFPSGIYNKSGDLISLQVGRTGIVICGDGNTTQLENIEIDMQGGARCVIKDLLFRGGLGAGIKSTKSGSSFSRQNIFSNLYIRDKVNGVVIDGSSWNTWDNVTVEKCSGDGWVVLSTNGEQITNCYSFSNDGKGLYIESGGELKLVNFSSHNNAGFGVHVYGDDDKTNVEHYYTNLTSTIQQRTRLGSITAISNNGGNAQITVANHLLAEGMIDVNITDTINYNGNYNVVSVIDENNFVINEPYTVDEANGQINLPNWDLVIHSDSVNTTRVNDQFFTGGNINYTRILNGYNIQFIGVRLKNQFYIDGGALIYRTGSARGRMSNTFAPVRASGNTQSLISDINFNTTAVAGNDSTEKSYAGTLTSLSSDGYSATSYLTGTTGFMSDDTVFSFTPQHPRGFIKITNGAGQNARVIDLVYDTQTPNAALAGYQGAVMEFTTGPLSGTTGGDGKITVSASDDGKIYIENRNGNQKFYWTIFR